MATGAKSTGDASADNPVLQEFKVLSGALVLKLDKEGKKVKRFMRGEIVKLDPAIHDIERLTGTLVVGAKDARFPTSAGQAAATNKYNQEQRAELVDSGEVAQSEDDVTKPVNSLDDGGTGSSPVIPPVAP